MSEYFVDESDNYLTMARLCNEEFKNWQLKNRVAWHNMTGKEQTYSLNAFRDGFFAGFEARFFKQND